MSAEIHPWVETKLLPPRPHVQTVVRARLDEMLRRGSEARLTLVAAPAGFGKTSLLAGWLSTGGRERSTGWVSLDEQDRDASRFWAYVLHATDRAAPGTASAALAELRSHPDDIRPALARLLNELSVHPEDLTLVLDDYHLAEEPDLRPGMTFLIDHLPPQMHLVISTRVDPYLPLARWRTRGDLVEIRALDLRFTLTESAAYLNDACGLGLAAAEVAALDARTEGWAAALQLAALSLDGREDPSQFITGFSGDDRFVVDYLADEVLERQPPDQRRFLLETSVLDRLTAPLCDAVTERRDAADRLGDLERQNLFLIPLDRNRRWYRYHRLFADVLRARLLDERPDVLAALHRRAGDWYDDAGEPEAAVRHALAAGDVDSAAERVEIAIPAMLRERREDVVRLWADQLPSEVTAHRPVLAVGLIGGLMSSNRFDGVADRLREVEETLADQRDLVVVDHAELARLPASVETYRAALALAHGDLPGTIEHARTGLARAAEDDHLSLAAASALLGLVAWTHGDLEAAHDGYREATDHLSRAGHVADVVGCAITLADIEMTRGRIAAAERTFEEALTLADREAVPLRGTSDMYVGRSRVSYQRGDLPGAAEHLRRADELGEGAGLPQNPYRWRVAMAHLRAAEGDLATAVALLDEAERVYVGDFTPNVQPIAATRARMQAAGGEVAHAQEWVRRIGISSHDDLTYLREYEHVTLARVLLADATATRSEARLAEVLGLLDRLLEAAEAAERVGTMIQVLVLQALALRSAGSREALPVIARAVRLAEPDGHVQVFLDLGRPHLATMVDLLGTGGMEESVFLRRLRGAAASHGHSRSGRPGAEPGGPALIEPLSKRERDVLRMLRSDLDGPAIARELGVSLATVRTHTQHIFAKLGVNNRRAAVRRAHQLNLFSRSTRD